MSTPKASPLTNSAAKVTRAQKPAAPPMNTNRPSIAAPIQRRPLGQAKKG